MMERAGTRFLKFSQKDASRNSVPEPIFFTKIALLVIN
jgi:hypothetical protein